MTHSSLTQRCRLCLMLLICGLAASCSPRISPTATVATPQAMADFAEDYYLQSKASGAQVLRIDPKRSLVTIEVRRGGALARLGHDHVVASHDVTGYADITKGRADLLVPLDLLAVDEPELRAEAGLDSPLSAEAIAGTRRNMLDKVLESSRHPYAQVSIVRNTTDSNMLKVAIKLHNTLNYFNINAKIETSPAGMAISGKLTLKQSDFGITPFSILGGAMQVQDDLLLRFRIFATPL